VKDDDPSIDGSETLYWRAPQLPQENWTIFDEGRNSHRVRGGSFVWNDDGVSCYRHTVLHGLDLDWQCIKKEPKNGILSVDADDVRACQLGVAPDPDPDYIPQEQLQPQDKAHALIVIEDGVNRRKRGDRCSRLARAAKIVHWGDGADEPQGR
jgi:hypothetical protein